MVHVSNATRVPFQVLATGIAAARYLCIGKTSGFRNRQFRERASQTTSFWSRVNNCIPVINIMMLLITISR